jgi:hypothetical protein
MCLNYVRLIQESDGMVKVKVLDSPLDSCGRGVGIIAQTDIPSDTIISHVEGVLIPPPYQSFQNKEGENFRY